MFQCCLSVSASVAWCYHSRENCQITTRKYGLFCKAYCRSQEQSLLFFPDSLNCSTTALFPLFSFMFQMSVLVLKPHFPLTLLSFQTPRDTQRMVCETEEKHDKLRWTLQCGFFFVFPCRWTATWLWIKIYLEEQEDGKNIYVCMRSGLLRIRLPFSN